MRRFEGRVALITGGAAGIGLATARRLMEEGALVLLLDHSAEDLERASVALAASGSDVVIRHGSVAERVDCESAVEDALRRWGRLDVLVANAAVRAFGSVLDATEEEWERILSVNLRGAANACVAAGHEMRRAGRGGAMVLVSSVHAVVGRADMPLYDAAKAGVISLTRSLAVDLAPHGVRVNSVCPGFTITDFHIRRALEHGRSVEDLRATRSGLLGRPAEPAEVAGPIAFLASDDASYITGTNLMVDAGTHSI